MRTTSTALKSMMLKKKLSSDLNLSSTSSSTLSSENQKSNQNILNPISDKDKLTQLKQKLEQERQNMRKSGRRFKDQSNNSQGTGNQIEIQTDLAEGSIQPVTNQNKMKKQITKIKTSTISTGTSSLSSGLYDFTSIKKQVQNKSNKLFMKKSVNKTNQVIYTAQRLTANQIIAKHNQQINQIKSDDEKNENQQRKKDTINLMELLTVIQKSPEKAQMKKNTSKQKIGDLKFVQLTKKSTSKINQYEKDILSNSKVFQSAIKEQKRKNKQVEDFLSFVGLEQFSEGFISIGYDQVDTLIQVQVDDLNQLMMRAFQQDKLMQLIKRYKKQNEIEIQAQKPLITQPSRIHSRLGYRPKSAVLTTEPSQTNQTPSSSRLLKSKVYNMKESTLANKSSIFYSMGGTEWSLESQIRKACSGCFKVTQQTVKRGDCYYCQSCDSGEFELDFICLDQSIVRDYQK